MLIAWASQQQGVGENAYPLADRIYVSNVLAWGIPVGNDTTGDGSRSNPYLTLNKAVTVAVTGKVALLNGVPASPTTYTNTTHNISKNMTVDSVASYGATLINSTATQGVVRNTTAGITVTLGKIILNAQNLSRYCVEMGSGLAANGIICNGTKFLNPIWHGVFLNNTADNSATVVLNDCIWVQGSSRTLVDAQRMIAGGVTINGGTASIASTANGGFLGNYTATASGVTLSISGLRATVNVDSNGVSNVTGLAVVNILGAVVQDNAFVVGSATNNPLKAIVIVPTSASPLDTGNFRVRRNRIDLDCGGGGGIWVGLDGTGTLTYADGLLNGGIVEDNIVVSSPTTPSVHSLFNSCRANTIFRRNYLFGGYGLVDKNGLNALATANIFDGCTSEFILCKGTEGTLILHNTFIARDTVNGGGIRLQTNDVYSSTTGVIDQGNLFVNVGSGGFTTVSIEAGTAAPTATYNDYYNSGSGSLAWGGAGGSYSVFATYQAAEEPTALNVDPLFTNAGAGDYSLRAGSPIKGIVPANVLAPTDYTGAVFLDPASVGAYQ